MTKVETTHATLNAAIGRAVLDVLSAGSGAVEISLCAGEAVLRRWLVSCREPGLVRVESMGAL